MSNNYRSLMALVCALCVTTILFMAPERTCRAELVEYQINWEESWLDISGNYQGYAFEEQAAGSLRATYSGTISADLSGGVLTFSGGSTIVANQNPSGPFKPDPVAIGDVDNYGVTVPVLPGVALADGVIRDMRLDFTMGTVAHNEVPNTLEIEVPYYVFAYEVYLLAPDKDEYETSEDPMINNPTTAASLTLDGLVERLVVPIFLDSGTGDELRMIFDGQIVAYRVVPEPSTWMLMGIGLIGIALLRRRRNRT